MMNFFLALSMFEVLNSHPLACIKLSSCEALPGESHVARLNFKTSHVGVYKCLSLIVSFAVTVAIWPREVVSCRDLLLFGPCRLSEFTLAGPQLC